MTPEPSAEDLTPCPCGRSACWYRVVPHPFKPGRGPVEVMAADDFYDDLCEECFGRVVPEEEREGWMRVVGPRGRE